MATDVEITDPKLSVYVPVPPAGAPGVCRICHGATTFRDDDRYWPTCWNCRDIPAHGVRLIVPVSLVHTSESQLYAAARDYKSPSISEAARSTHSLFLAATLQRYLREHRSCISDAADAEWETITVVPSAGGRPLPHPLETSVQRAPALREEHERLLRWTGQEIDHTHPNPAAFEPITDIEGSKILLIDDTFTSGANIQSAAAAIAAGGGHVVAAAPVGRVIDTRGERFPEKLDFWRGQRGMAFSFETCCLEAP